MSRKTSIAPLPAIGALVRAVFLRFDGPAGQAVLQLPGNMPAYMSTYDMSIETFQGLKPGDFIDATVIRVDCSSAAPSAVLEEQSSASDNHRQIAY